MIPNTHFTQVKKQTSPYNCLSNWAAFNILQLFGGTLTNTEKPLEVGGDDRPCLSVSRLSGMSPPPGRQYVKKTSSLFCIFLYSVRSKSHIPSCCEGELWSSIHLLRLPTSVHLMSIFILISHRPNGAVGVVAERTSQTCWWPRAAAFYVSDSGERRVNMGANPGF